jgi:hypothetical protein
LWQLPEAGRQTEVVVRPGCSFGLLLWAFAGVHPEGHSLECPLVFGLDSVTESLQIINSDEVRARRVQELADPPDV